MRVALVLIAVCATLSGCGGGQLAPDNSVTSTVASTRSSEVTYRNILKVTKDCYPDAVTVRSNYFPEAKEGEIELLSVHELGNNQFAVLLVKPTPNGSLVTMTRKTRHKAFDEALPEWVDGNSRLCPIGTRSEPRPPGSDTNQNIMPVR